MPWAPPKPVLDCLRLRFVKRTQGVCGKVEEFGVSFRKWTVAGSKALVNNNQWRQFMLFFFHKLTSIYSYLEYA